MTTTHDARTAGLREAVAFKILSMIKGRTNADGSFTRVLTCSSEEAARILLTPTGPIASHIAEIEAERDSLSYRRRWNVEERDGGVVAICQGDHHRSEDCEWIDYTPMHRTLTAEAEVTRLTAALDAATAALDAADYLADRYRALWEGKTVRDITEAEASYSSASKILGRARSTLDTLRTQGGERE
ncbi:hypothetical protein G3T14_18110 [Methylobacterium sp. BTF04]|uniref:hypothetical protein n=1 Tax=Methylobacterium sp. BTF04 TaxID=2708300 RepID=UPI0013D563B7|nr:hypothetical protein [Methylobacterium sp. BTF04]NEU14029.1 hypothetical protein [Methylobacterium sp. BTF04]